MASIYRPHDLYSAQLDPEKCKASVPNEGRSVRFHQCLRAPSKDGWCWQHHPDAEAMRAEEAMRRYEAKRERSPWRRIEKMGAVIVELQAENARVRGALEMVEWVEGDEPLERSGGMNEAVCPWCDVAYPKHAPDCQRQAALEDNNA